MSTSSSDIDTPPSTLPTKSHTSIITPSPVGLPSLPFELQIEILSQIPLYSLFGLRRTSIAWNAMLTNPHLLEYICNHRAPPYLSSATSLVSRLKRRLRMRLNKPVWVKPFEEAFPWAKIAERVHNRAPWRRWERYWNGWLVVIIVRPPLEVERASSITVSAEDFHPRALVLKIGHVAGVQNSAVEVDLLESVREKFPQVGELLKEEISEVFSQPYGKRLEIYNFIVLEGKILISIRVNREGWFSTGESPGEILSNYLFVFDFSGAVVCHITLPNGHSWPWPFLVTRCSSTHVVVMDVYNRRNPRYQAATGYCPSQVTCTINTYSLTSGEKVMPEITGRRLQGNWAGTRSQDPNLDTDQYINYRFGFDDSEMIWFPQFADYNLEFSCTEPENDKVLVWRAESLPLSPCGGWVVFSALHGLPQESAEVFSSVSWEEEMEKERTAIPGEVSTHEQVFSKMPHLLLTTYADTTIKVSIDPAYENEYAKSFLFGTLINLVSEAGRVIQPQLIFQKWNSKRGYSSNTTRRITIPPQCLLELVSVYQVSKYYEDGRLQGPTTTHKGILWGYLGVSKHGDKQELSQSLDLLPYGGSDEGDVEEGICNGIPEDAWQKMATPRLTVSASGRTAPHRHGVKWSWGDDGIICWGIGRKFGNRSMDSVNSWVACYEEEWAWPDQEGETEQEKSGSSNDVS